MNFGREHTRSLFSSHQLTEYDLKSGQPILNWFNQFAGWEGDEAIRISVSTIWPDSTISQIGPFRRNTNSCIMTLRDLWLDPTNLQGMTRDPTLIASDGDSSIYILQSSGI